MFEYLPEPIMVHAREGDVIGTDFDHILRVTPRSSGMRTEESVTDFVKEVRKRTAAKMPSHTDSPAEARYVDHGQRAGEQENSETTWYRQRITTSVCLYIVCQSVDFEDLLLEV